MIDYKNLELKTNDKFVDSVKFYVSKSKIKHVDLLENDITLVLKVVTESVVAEFIYSKATSHVVENVISIIDIKDYIKAGVINV